LVYKVLRLWTKLKLGWNLLLMVMFGGFESLLEVLSKYIIFFLTFYMLVIGLQFERELVSLK
jgi:hypothetical protein